MNVMFISLWHSYSDLAPLVEQPKSVYHWYEINVSEKKKTNIEIMFLLQFPLLIIFRIMNCLFSI